MVWQASSSGPSLFNLLIFDFLNFHNFFDFHILHDLYIFQLVLQL